MHAGGRLGSNPDDPPQEQLALYVIDHVQKKMVELGMKAVSIPLNAAPNEPQSTVFVSTNAYTNNNKLLVLMQDQGRVRYKC